MLRTLTAVAFQNDLLEKLKQEKNSELFPIYLYLVF